MDRILKLFICIALLGTIAGCSQKGRGIHNENISSGYASAEVRENISIAQLTSSPLISGAFVSGKLTITIPVDNFFRPGGEILIRKNKAALKNLAAMIRRRNDREVIIVAFSDGVGDKKNALELAHSQANLVASFLWDAGIDSEQVSVHAHEARIISGQTLAARAINRRIEITLIK